MRTPFIFEESTNIHPLESRDVVTWVLVAVTAVLHVVETCPPLLNGAGCDDPSSSHGGTGGVGLRDGKYAVRLLHGDEEVGSAAGDDPPSEGPVCDKGQGGEEKEDERGEQASPTTGEGEAHHEEKARQRHRRGENERPLLPLPSSFAFEILRCPPHEDSLCRNCKEGNTVRDTPETRCGKERVAPCTFTPHSDKEKKETECGEDRDSLQKKEDRIVGEEGSLLGRGYREEKPQVPTIGLDRTHFFSCSMS